MNEDLYLEKMAEAQYLYANNREYGKHKFVEGDPGYGPEFCDECDAEMHPCRREYGFRLCVSCKSLRERFSR